MTDDTKFLISRVQSGIQGTKYEMSVVEFYHKEDQANYIRITMSWMRGAVYGLKPAQRQEWVQFDEQTRIVHKVSDPDTQVVMWLIKYFLRTLTLSN